MFKITRTIILSLLCFMPYGESKSTDEASSKRLKSHFKELDDIILPEIKNDMFYKAIYWLTRTQPINTILEIGSSSGEGSTEAFVTGIKDNPNHPKLFCMEISNTRFKALNKRYKDNPAVICYQASSVPAAAFPQEEEISLFYHTTQTNLNHFPLALVLEWLRRDIEYVNSHNVPQNGIQLIKDENGILDFDMVLIDGSEFTGNAELKFIYGAKFILLDDINTFKNYNNYKRLLEDPNYDLLQDNHNVRNGYAIFAKKPS